MVADFTQTRIYVNLFNSDAQLFQTVLQLSHLIKNMTEDLTWCTVHVGARPKHDKKSEPAVSRHRGTNQTSVGGQKLGSNNDTNVVPSGAATGAVPKQKVRLNSCILPS